MGRKVHDFGYDSIAEPKATGSWGEYWHTSPKGTPANFEGRIIFTFEDGTIVEYNSQKGLYIDRDF